MASNTGWMTDTVPQQRRYDHRLKHLVQTTGDIAIATESGVPVSTARGWLTQSPTDVVSLELFDLKTTQLQHEVIRLRRRIAKLTSLLRLAIVVLNISGFSLVRCRIGDGSNKKRLLRAIQRTRSRMALRTTLRAIGLSRARYHEWNNSERCELDDRSSCPKTLPHQLTLEEVNTIRDMATSPTFRHVPTSGLARLAQRLGRVFASAATWHRLIRIHKWRRCRHRVHPARPKVGIRATRAKEIWHVDTTMIRLLDGSRAYLHAVIDNFSRRILAWSVAGSFHPAITASLLKSASESTTTSEKPTVLVDGGIENFNSAVDEVVESGILKRILAQTEITFSNSLIESWWRVLKHQWLYLNTLDSVCTVRKLVAFYVEQHNSHLPHSAFNGQTPDEMYLGTGDKIPEQLHAARIAAREARIQSNRSQKCRACEEPITITCG